jgi:hypothetical protein
LQLRSRMRTCSTHISAAGSFDVSKLIQRKGDQTRYTVTSWPCFLNEMAAVSPAIPAPTTMTLSGRFAPSSVPLTCSLSFMMESDLSLRVCLTKTPRTMNFPCCLPSHTQATGPYTYTHLYSGCGQRTQSAVREYLCLPRSSSRSGIRRICPQSRYRCGGQRASPHTSSTGPTAASTHLIGITATFSLSARA